MSTTYTTYYNLAKADPEWSSLLNGNFTTLDTQLKAVANAAAGAASIVLAPEYRSGGWHDDNSGSAITDANGTIKFQGAGPRNAYFMSCSDPSNLKDFTCQVEVRLPTTFSTWNASAILIDFCTQTGTAGQQALDVAVHRNRGGSAICTSTGNTSNGSWSQVTIAKTSLEAGPTVWGAGDVLTLKLKCKSMGDYWVKLGEISVQCQ